MIDRLSDREREVLRALCEGQTYKEIAVRLGIRHSTVRSHVSKVIAKLKVADAKQAIAVVLSGGDDLGPVSALPPFAVPYLDALDRHLADGSDRRAARDLDLAVTGLAGRCVPRSRTAFLDAVVRAVGA